MLLTFEMSFIVIVIAAIAALGAILAYLLYCVGLRARQEQPDPEWLQTFSVQRYRPMVRMLSDTDFSYLRLHGLNPSQARHLRCERRRIFRVYLKNLVRDFNRLHWAAHTILLASEVDNPELAERLVRTRVQFERAVLSVRVRLALSTIGVGGLEPGRILDAI